MTSAFDVRSRCTIDVNQSAKMGHSIDFLPLFTSYFKSIGLNVCLKDNIIDSRQLPSDDFEPVAFDCRFSIECGTNGNLNTAVALLSKWCGSSKVLPQIQIPNLFRKIFDVRSFPNDNVVVGSPFNFGTFGSSPSIYYIHYESNYCDQRLVFEHDRRVINVVFAANSNKNNVCDDDDDLLDDFNDLFVDYNDMFDDYQFEHHQTASAGCFKMEIFYQNVSQVIINIDEATQNWNVYFILSVQPKSYVADNNRYQSVRSTVDFNDSTYSYRILNADGCNPQVFAKCNVFCITLPAHTATEVIGRFCLQSRIEPWFVPISDHKPASGNKINLSLKCGFDCDYAVIVLFSRGFQLYNQAARLIPLIQRAVSKNQKATMKTLYRLAQAVDSGKPFVDFEFAFSRLFDNFVKYPRLGDLPEYQGHRYVRRALFTPTGILFLAPEIMQENRILRQYGDDFALRINFRDVDFSRLQGASFNTNNPRQKTSMDTIFNACVRDRILNGVKIGNRIYEFLAWSNSQLRDHGCWLYASDSKGYSASSIRRNMGDFDHIMVIPKYMARMGQCFSQSEEAVKMEVDERNISCEEDIERCDHRFGNKYCFSDGVGRISKSLIGKVCENLGVVPTRSALQIRYSGYKGMLTMDPYMSGSRIIFRESQKKFESQSRGLEVMKAAQPSRLFLNRPILLLLDQKRVNRSVFHVLQETMLMNYSNMLIYETSASSNLSISTVLPISFNTLRINGCKLTQEPFFRSMLLAVHKKAISQLTYKARIQIPNNEGRNMFGVMDETNTLQYGQVFIQYSKSIGEPHAETRIVQGRVLVTKNPCSHLGDVRMLAAIDVRSLHHLVDVIVFPQRGHRPHPNEMAGSDLDGDEFFVCWHQELFFNQNHPPMDFPAAPKLKHSGPINLEDMVNCLVAYIQNDCIGIVASYLLAHADNQLKGFESDVCLSLAAKHSLAVDFAKSGVPAVIDNKTERPSKYPDYMGGSGRRYSYASRSLLGQLFRKARRVDDLTKYGFQSPIVTVDERFRMRGFEEYIQEAKSARNVYNAELSALMSQYCVENEGEILSGNIIKIALRLNGREDQREAEKIIKMRLSVLWKKTRQDFFREIVQLVGITEDNFKTGENQVLRDPSLRTLALQKASAWYMVTYDSEYGNYFKLISFPWIVSDLLADILLDYSSANEHNDDLTFAENPLAFKVCNLLNETFRNSSYGIDIDRGAHYFNRVLAENHILQLVVNKCPELRQVFIILLAWGAWYRERDGRRFQYDMFTFLILKFLDSIGFLQRNGLNQYGPVTMEELKSYSNNNGEIIVSIMRYWASQKFRNLTVISFDEFKSKLVSRNNERGWIHQEAFNTFHYLALTHNCDHFFVEQFETYDMPMDSIQVDPSLFGNTVLPNVEASLKVMSDMQSVEIRKRTVGRKSFLLVTGFGRVTAIDKLRNILTTTNPEIISNLMNDEKTAINVEQILWNEDL